MKKERNIGSRESPVNRLARLASGVVLNAGIVAHDDWYRFFCAGTFEAHVQIHSLGTPPSNIDAWEVLSTLLTGVCV